MPTRRLASGAAERTLTGALTMPSHLLIVSDLHIGEHTKEVDRIGYLKRLGRHDEDFCAFLDFHKKRRISGDPWRLIINGDFIDFLAITVRPSDQAGHDDPRLLVSTDESQWGLDSSPGKAVWKLERVAERHRMLLTYLADFIGDGNQVEILYGNHDIEFWWPEVHTKLRQILRRIYFGTELVAGHDPQAFEARIVFHPWFIYAPGKYYIEHGNQYDDFSNFLFRLNPVMPNDPHQLAMPASHMAIRYFVNHYEGFRSHDKDDWTLVDYVQWLRQQSRHDILRVIRLSTAAAYHLWVYSEKARTTDMSELGHVHEEQLEALAATWDLSLERARAIDALMRVPIAQSLGRTIQSIGLDRAVLVLVWLLALFAVWVVPLPWLWTLVAWLTVTVALAITLRLWGHVQDRYLGGEVTTSVAPKVDRAAGDLSELLGVRYVIMGHTHHPRKVQLRTQPDAWYINTGSWLAPKRRERHGKHGCPSRLTFAVLRDGNAPDARLFRWCAHDGKPVAFDPRSGLDALEREQVTPSSIRRGPRTQREGAGARTGRLRLTRRGARKGRTRR